MVTLWTTALGPHSLSERCRKGGAMASVEQSIEVDVPLAAAQEAWKGFTEWVLIGNYRLVCDAWSCERMTDRSTVTLSGLDEHRSRVTVSFALDEGPSPDPQEKTRRVNARLAQDLMKFREYVQAELGGRRHGGPDRRGGSDSDDRAGRLRVTSDSVIERDHDDLLGSPHYLA
jgi:hypothetical protein